MLKINKPGKTATQTKATTKPESSSQVQALKSQSVAIPLTVEQIGKIKVFIYGRIEIDEYKELHKQCELIRKELVAYAAENVPNDESAIFMTEFGQVGFEPAPDTRVVKDLKGLCAALKDKLGSYDKVLELLSISLSDADMYLGAQEVEKYIEHVPGTRKIAGYQKSADA